MNEDLLTTNKIGEGFQEYVNALNRSNNVYDSDKPKFFESREKTADFGNIDQSSIGYDQFKNLEFEGIRKRKKIQRTVINIDSKNRKKNYTFNEDIIQFDAKSNSKIRFYKNDRFFYIICDDTYIDDTRDKKELIIYNLEDDLTDKLGIDKDIFEYNRSTGRPVFFVNRFLYNSKQDPTSLGYKNPKDSSNVANKYNISSKQYVFNIIEVLIPTTINTNEINGLEYNGHVNISFIFDVDISYTSPSHYKLALNRTYSNVYAVRLVSSEIPNTAYSFNGIETSTNVGKNTLRTKVNNRLRWLNQADRHDFSTYKLAQYNHYDYISPYYIDSSHKSQFQNKQEILNRTLFNKNFHSLSIRTYSYSNLELVKQSLINTPRLTIGNNTIIDEIFTSTEGEFYYLFNYFNLINKLDTNFGDVKLKHLYKNVYNTLYIDNDDSIDDIKINNVTGTNGLSTINDDDNIILSVQVKKEQNNIYKIKKDMLVSFQLLNFGKNYQESDLDKIKLYRYDHDYKQYELNSIGNDDGDITPQIVDGKITNITLDTDIKLDPVYNSSIRYNHLDYFYGIKGFFEHTHFVDKSKNGVEYDKNISYFDIINYTFQDVSNNKTYLILDDKGDFYKGTAYHNIFDKDSNGDYIFSQTMFTEVLKKLGGVYGGVDANEDLSDTSTLTLKLRYKNSSYINKDPLSDLDIQNKDKFILSISEVDINLELDDTVRKRIIDDDIKGFKNLFNVTDFTIIDYKNLYAPGEVVLGEIKFQDQASNPSYIYKFYLKIYMRPEMINTSKFQDNPLNSQVTEGIGFECRTAISSRYKAYINSDTELSRELNKSYLKLRDGEDQYFYLYKSKDGKFSRDNYYLVNNNNGYYQFLYTNVIRNYERMSPYIRINDVEINDDISIRKRDYNSNLELIGDINKYGLSTIDTKCFEDTSSFVTHNIYSQMANFLKSNSIIKGGISSSFISDDSYIYFSFNDNFNMILSIFSHKNNQAYYDKDLISRVFDNKKLPINVSMIALEDVLYYNFVITSISKLNTNSVGRLVESYLLTIIPESGDFDSLLRFKPFKSNNLSNTALMIIRNPIDSTKYSRLETFFPDYINYLKNDYSEYIIDKIPKTLSNSVINPGDSVSNISDIYDFNNQSNLNNQLIYTPIIMNNLFSGTPGSNEITDLFNDFKTCFESVRNTTAVKNRYPLNYYYLKFTPINFISETLSSSKYIKLTTSLTGSKIQISKSIPIEDEISSALDVIDNLEIIFMKNGYKIHIMTQLLDDKKFIDFDGTYHFIHLNKLTYIDEADNTEKTLLGNSTTSKSYNIKFYCKK